MPAPKKPTKKTAAKAKAEAGPVIHPDALEAHLERPNLRVVTIVLDLDDPEQPIEIGYDEATVSRLEVWAMVGEAHEIMERKASTFPTDD